MTSQVVVTGIDYKSLTKEQFEILLLEHCFFEKIRGESTSSFNFKYVANDLIINHHNNQDICLHYKNGILFAFLRYSINNFELEIKSFVLNKTIFDNRNFKNFIKYVYSNLLRLHFNKITTKVYKGNLESINLQMKLKFKVISKNDQFWTFKIDREEFLSCLKKYIS